MIDGLPKGHSWTIVKRNNGVGVIMDDEHVALVERPTKRKILKACSDLVNDWEEFVGSVDTNGETLKLVKASVKTTTGRNIPQVLPDLPKGYSWKLAPYSSSLKFRIELFDEDSKYGVNSTRVSYSYDDDLSILISAALKLRMKTFGL